MPSRNPNSLLLAFFGIIVISGSVYVAVRLSNFELPPFWGAGLRFSVSSILFIAIVAMRRIALPRGKALLGALVYGVLGFGASNAFFYYALVNVQAGLTSVIFALVPLSTLFLASAQNQEHLGLRGIMGALVALAGTAIVFQAQLTSRIPLLSLLALAGAILCSAETSIALKHFPQSDPFATLAVAMTTGSLMLLALSALVGEAWLLPVQPTTSIAFAYLVLVGSASSVLYLYVLSGWTATATNYSFVLVPIVTVLLAALFEGEVVNLAFIAGSALVLLGVYLGALFRVGKPSR
ncbi:MAG: EamA family transporter [Thaumarchaeota archaeon]|nr:EamA family transporter [Nitrososphaerota archaeon]